MNGSLLWTTFVCYVKNRKYTEGLIYSRDGHTFHLLRRSLRGSILLVLGLASGFACRGTGGCPRFLNLGLLVFGCGFSNKKASLKQLRG